VSGYNKLPIAQKRMEALSRAREPAVTCPACDVQVMPVDLLTHMKDRCPGPREPGPASQWLTWAEAVVIVKVAGLTEIVISKWVRRGEVRHRGPRGDREYLLRDLVLKVAAQMKRSRR
jgi:hypothetical protein